MKTAGSWSSGLCDCCSDMPTSYILIIFGVTMGCLTFWCPCVTFGRIAEIVDQGTTTCPASGAIYGLLAYFTGCACLYSCTYRSRMRKEYMLKESPCNDCLIHWCCETCALCQEYRELKNRGFDMSLGWEGNVRRQNHGAGTMAPPSVQAFGGK